MAEKRTETDHLEVIKLSSELFDDHLRNTDATTELVENFSNLERSVFMASQNGAMGIVEGLGTLAGFAGRGHQSCLTNGYSEGETFFMSKIETYRNMMEAMASRPEEKPKPTDTDKLQMSDPKNTI